MKNIGYLDYRCILEMLKSDWSIAGLEPLIKLCSKWCYQDFDELLCDVFVVTMATHQPMQKEMTGLQWFFYNLKYRISLNKRLGDSVI